MSDIRVLVDEELKNDAESVLKDLGLNISQAVRLFLIQVVKTEELPFNPYKKVVNKKGKKPTKN